jgi:hypothetical protein
VAKSEGRVLDFGDLVSSACVLCRLSEELFDLVSPALDTWKVVKGLMAFQGGSWSSVRSEDLPEGLSDRDEGSRSRRKPRRSQVRQGLLGLATLGSRNPTCPK